MTKRVELMYEDTRVSSTTIHREFEMRGPHDNRVKVTVVFEQFPDDPIRYWRSAQAEDGEIVEPWKDGTFQKGDGTILTAEAFPVFDRRLPVDPLPPKSD